MSEHAYGDVMTYSEWLLEFVSSPSISSLVRRVVLVAVTRHREGLVVCVEEVETLAQSHELSLSQFLEGLSMARAVGWLDSLDWAQGQRGVSFRLRVPDS